MNTNNSYQLLVLRDNAKHELEQIKSVEDGITYVNKLKSIEVWVKLEKKDAELQVLISEQKIRTQRILGELIQEGQRKGTIATAGVNQYGSTLKEEPLTVPQLGITHKQSSNFQAIASIPEDQFEDFIHEKKTAVNKAVKELTTTGAVKLAKSLQQKKDELKVNNDLQERLAVENELKQLAKDINMKYTKEQRIFLVNQIKQ
jgi:hypothetical protein